MKSSIILLLLSTFTASYLFAQAKLEKSNEKRAQQTLEKIEQCYAVNDGKHLYRETYPFDANFQATYLSGESDQPKANAYSYLWPFSGSLSAYVALFEKTKDIKLKKHIDQVVLPGLENYYDTRQPVGYASYINTAPQSDRFYDDNIWLGIDFSDLYLLTKDAKYLDKAVEIWQFVKSGMDDELGGGIYWCEQKKESKNTCSNAPAIVYLVKLYQASGEKVYLDEAIKLYTWTKTNLQDPDDLVYWDNINLKGKVQKSKYPYNSGQMIQAGALLYTATKDQKYLLDAQQAAAVAFHYFFSHDDQNANYPTLNQSDNWFIAVMLRGYAELYHLDHEDKYLAAFQQNLTHAWDAMRDKDGLFTKDWKASTAAEGKRWLLDQFAIAEMYARLSK